MKNLRQVFLVIVLFFLLAQKQTNAETFVNISNDGIGANSNVEVHSNISSSTSTSNNSNFKTNIRIETNGKVKTYESQNGESVHIESDDKTARVNISNRTGTTNKDLNPTTTESSRTATIKQNREKPNKITKRKKDVFEQIESYLRVIVSRFFFKISLH